MKTAAPAWHISTPFEIEILMHYHCHCGSDYRNGDFSAPALPGIIANFVQHGLIRKLRSVYYITNYGRKYVEALCSVPLPAKADETRYEYYWVASMDMLYRLNRKADVPFQYWSDENNEWNNSVCTPDNVTKRLKTDEHFFQRVPATSVEHYKQIVAS